MALSSGKLTFNCSNSVEAKKVAKDLISDSFMSNTKEYIKGASIFTDLLTGVVTFDIVGVGVSDNIGTIKTIAEAATGKTAAKSEIVKNQDSQVYVGG